jgi:Zn-dependent protease with chaperone function
MAVALTATALLVLYASALSLVLYLPARLWADSLPPRRAAGQARVWLLEMFLPPLLGALCAAWGLGRQLLHPLFSPHAGHVRPHLCIRPLLDAPDSQWRAGIFCGLCFFLVLLAVVALAVRLTRSARESVGLRRGGTRLPAEAGAPEVEIVQSEAVALASHRGPGRLVAVSPRLGQLFPGEAGRALLAHEVWHAHRRDSLWQTLAQSAVLLAALSPGSYLAYRRWLQARELCCDLRAAELTSWAVTTEALRRAQDLTGALEEVDPLAAPPLDTLQGLARRREALRQAEAAGPGTRSTRAGLALAVIVGVVLVALLVIAGRRIPDSLQCSAESFLRVLR